MGEVHPRRSTRIILAFVIALLLVSISVHALIFEDYSVRITLTRNDTAIYNVSILMLNDENTTLSRFEYSTDLSPSFIDFRDEEGSLDFDVRDGIYSCRLRRSLKRGERYRIRIDFEVEEQVFKGENDRRIFLASIFPGARTRNLTITLFLPEGAILSKPEAGITRSYVSPEPSYLETDGRRLIVRWIRRNLSENQGIGLAVSYQILSYEPIVAQTKSGFPLGLFLLAMILTALATFVATRYLSARKIENVVDIVMERALREDERRIIEILIDRKKIAQEDLPELTGMSKSKLSQILSDMERRGLIRRIEKGKTKEVILEEEISRLLS